MGTPLAQTPYANIPNATTSAADHRHDLDRIAASRTMQLLHSYGMITDDHAVVARLLAHVPLDLRIVGQQESDRLCCTINGRHELAPSEELG